MTETNIDNELLEATRPPEVDSSGCCVVPENIEAPIKAECPLSGTLSNKALFETLDNLIVHDKRHLISKDVLYYYCSEPDCPVVYFSSPARPSGPHSRTGHWSGGPARHWSGGEEVSVFEKSDLSVRVFSKDSSEDVNVCYCFDWTRKRLTDQIRTNGSSTAFDEIKEEVEAGNCDCERKNPKGVCCLGDVQNFLKEIS